MFSCGKMTTVKVESEFEPGYTLNIATIIIIIIIGSVELLTEVVCHVCSEAW